MVHGVAHAARRSAGSPEAERGETRTTTTVHGPVYAVATVFERT